MKIKYQVQIHNRAKREIKKLPRDTLQSIMQTIQNLAAEPRPHGVVKLTHNDNLYRIRIANYRVIYQISDLECIVLVVGVGHRRDVYKKH